MKVTWCRENEYSTLFKSAEWQKVSCGHEQAQADAHLKPVQTGRATAGIQIREEQLAGPRSLFAAGIVLIVFWGVVFWLLGAWTKVARFF